MKFAATSLTKKEKDNKKSDSRGSSQSAKRAGSQGHGYACRPCLAAAIRRLVLRLLLSF